MTITGRSNRYEVAGQLAQEQGDHASAAWAADQLRKETEMTVAFKCENCGGPVAADGYHLMGVPCDPQAARDAQARAINVTAKRVKGKKGYHATCELCGKEFTGKYHEVVSGEYAVHLSMNCDDPATWASFEQEVMRMRPRESDPIGSAHADPVG